MKKMVQGVKEMGQGAKDAAVQFAQKADNAIQEKEKSYLAARAEEGDKLRKEIEEARKDYFSIIQEDQDEKSTSTQRALGALGIKLYNAHLPYVGEAYEPICAFEPSKFDAASRIVSFDITRWVTDTEEKNIEKLINVYQTLSGENCNIALIYDRKQDGCKVTMAVVNTGDKSNRAIVTGYSDRLQRAIRGNFPGAEITEKKKWGVPDCMKGTVRYHDNCQVRKAYSVAAVTNLATDKSEDFISQSMEKLLDGIVPEKDEEYRLILLASPVSDAEVETQKDLLFAMYNALSPYAEWQESVSVNKSTTLGSGSSLAKSIGINAGVSVGMNVGVNFGVNAGINFGLNFGKTVNRNETVGEIQGKNKTITNYAVKHSLELLESQMKRLEQCSALGMWRFAAYAVSEAPAVAKDVARMYLALTQGEESYLSRAVLNFWHGTNQQKEAAVILENLKRILHPAFVLDKEKCEQYENYSMLPPEVDLFTLISGKELVRALNFPRKSVAGFPVINSAAFGRETHRFSVIETDGADAPGGDPADFLEIGKVVHMYQVENKKVSLDVNSLASHVFVTGSTGTGKSNTVYRIVTGLHDKQKNFMVIEPAKGEYKDALKGICDKVYGTNPNMPGMELLSINPFTFPTGEGVDRPIHVLEHIDRLTEILNACWPMYAAMPAVLKDAIEKTYIKKGWDLVSSRCRCDLSDAFPTFKDLLIALPEVVNSSAYSQDTKSDYAGALVTRVKSLTNGINGRVLCAGTELSDEEMFRHNIVVDISRVGSVETKALLMGVLIMKLQEYHMSSSAVSNEDLQHVTVLEEAHNLLRRTSFGQAQDSANLQGKSVEMLTNSIAEMRTYGEGFIIADQAPGLLDEAVIRNTNTKIILRLPDAADRELVGRAAALREDQIEELAKLPRGVAAVYQNDWVEAVLCRFEKYAPEPPAPEPPASEPPASASASPSANGAATQTDAAAEKTDPEKIAYNEYFEILFQMRDNRGMEKEAADRIANWIAGLPYPPDTQNILRKVLRKEPLTEKEMQRAAYNLFAGKAAAIALRDGVEDASKEIEKADEKLKRMWQLDNDELVRRIRQLILQYVADKPNVDSFVERYQKFIGRGPM